MFCTYCGNELTADTRFCPACGKANSLSPGPEQIPPQNARRLELDIARKKIGGVCAGFARYLDWDVTLVRLIFVAGLVLYFFTLLIYLVCWLVMPRSDQPAYSSAS